MKISALKNINYVNYTPYTSVKNKADYNCNNTYTPIPAGKISHVYFTGATSVKPTKFLKPTLNLLDDIYKKYEENLMEVPLDEIVKIADELVSETGKSKEEVLEAMSYVTQFSGMTSLNTIGEVLSEQKVEAIGDTANWFKWKHHHKYIPDTDEFRAFTKNDKGLNSTMNYLLNEKNICPLDEKNRNVAIFLDKSKISQLEQLKDEDKDSFDFLRTYPKVKFFFLSGWDSGVTFLDRTKSIKESAKLVLESKNLDDALMRRVDELGIDPIIITNKSKPSEKAIHEHISPLKMTKTEFLSLIDANSQERVGGEKNLLAAKDITANYLKETLNVYSPERMSYALKDFHTQIVEIAKSKGKTEKDIVYIIPALDKSYSYVNYSYQKINNIPDKYFKTVDEIRCDRDLIKNKFAVVLDDCSITGNSVESLAENNSFGYQMIYADDVLFACVNGNENARYKFYGKNLTKKANLVFWEETPNHDFSKQYDKEDFHIVIGEFGYCEGGQAKVFPYMSPDNNSELGSNIALLHNVNYRKNSKNYKEAIFSAIKSPSAKIMKIAKTAEEISKSNPDYYSDTAKGVTFINLSKLSKMEMWKKYKEYLAELETKQWYD